MNNSIAYTPIFALHAPKCEQSLHLSDALTQMREMIGTMCEGAQCYKNRGK